MDFDSLLEKYPPDRKTLVSKNREERPPVTEGGRAAWLRRPCQDSLDLHGMNSAEATVALKNFIKSMRRRGLRKALVVHGKGLHSPGGSVLKPMVREFLESSAEVGEFGGASRKDGGSGASWFVLRQRSR